MNYSYRKQLSEEDAAFLTDNPFFEGDYLWYYTDILEKDIPCRKIIDIGCVNGFQSYFLEGLSYTGVDCYRCHWFRDHGNYINGYFPDIDLDLSDSIVIVNMSVGYFNSWNGTSNEAIAE